MYNPSLKGRNCVFATNNCHKWNLGIWLRTRIETSELCLDGKKFTWTQKFRRQASKVKEMMIMAYNNTGLIAVYIVPYGRTTHQHVFLHFLRKILRLKFDKCVYKCSILWSFSMTMLIHVLQRRLPPFFRNMAGKCSTIHHTVLIWVSETTIYSQNSRNHSRWFVSAT